MADPPNSTDFLCLPRLKLSHDVVNGKFTGRICRPDVYMLDDRYLICTSNLAHKRQCINLVDLKFNRIEQSYQIVPFDNRDIKPGYKYVPFDRNHGILYALMKLYKVKLNKATGQAELLHKGVSLDIWNELNDSIEQIIFLKINYVDFVFTFYSSSINLDLDVFRWDNLEKVKQGSCMLVEESDYHPSTFFASVIDDQILMIDCEHTGQLTSDHSPMSLVRFEFTDNCGDYDTLETHGITEWPEGIKVNFSGGWRTNQFICCVQFYPDDQPPQTDIYTLNVRNKVWSRIVKKTGGPSVRLIPKLNATTESLNFFSFERRKTQILWMPIVKPKSLEFLSHLVVLKSGFFENRTKVCDRLDQIRKQLKQIVALKRSIRTLKREAIEFYQNDPGCSLPDYMNLKMPKLARKIKKLNSKC